MNILLAAATGGEIGPAREWLRTQGRQVTGTEFALSGASVHICITGVGIMAATASLTRALLSTRYDFALQAGVAGVFERNIPLGEVVRVESEILADLGAEDGDGSFLDVYALGLAGKDDAPFRDGRLVSTGLEGPPGAAFSGLRRVSAITVQTVSGSETTIAIRAARYGADVETMEGAPFHYCCLEAGVPFLQLRAISNYVEPRNREAWKMREAVSALNETLTAWFDGFITSAPAGLE